MSDNLEQQTEYPVVLPVLPLRNIVVFPGMIVPLFVGREKSIRALEDVMANDKDMLLVSQKDGDQDDPEPKDMHEIGTIGTVLQMLKLPDGTVKVLVEGQSRAKMLDYLDNEAFFEASALMLTDLARPPLNWTVLRSPPSISAASLPAATTTVVPLEWA